MTPAQLTGKSADHITTLADLRCELHLGVKAAFLDMRAAAREQGIDLVAASAYRTFERQLQIWNAKYAGERPVYDAAGTLIDMLSLDPGERIEAIVQAGIPFMAHIGMLPQSVHEEGGYRLKGRTQSEIEQLINDAHAVEKAGAFAVVLEIVTADAARQITEAIGIPTIGIGSGDHCDGQILVTHDLIGLFPWFTPKFVAPAAGLCPNTSPQGGR